MFFIHYKGFHLLMHIIEGKILLILQLLKNLRRAEAKLAKNIQKSLKYWLLYVVDDLCLVLDWTPKPKHMKLV